MSGTVMILRNLFAGLLLWMLPLILSGQRNISGRITDAGFSSPIPGVSVVYSHFENQLEVYPQEKIHLHTDRDVYVPGEKIWFKAYIVDALSHQYAPVSQYVYVELISPVDTLINRVMILQTDGMFYGHLPITDFVPEGNYTLRAYTRYMENLGDDYFFKKNIRIGNLAKSRENGERMGKSESRRNRENQINHTNHSQDFDVSFYPEGGNLLEGVFCKVAFKALKRDGTSESISGEITDENGNRITSIETFYAGMGAFSFIPNPEKRYYLNCRNENGLEKQFELPKPVPNAFALTASKKYGRISVGVNKSASSPDIPCYLLAHCRGMVIYFAEWDKRNESVSFSEDVLPAGVIQFVLFDTEMNPLSERLVFCKNDNATAKDDFKTNKASYEKREKVIATLTPSLWGRAGEGILGRVGEGLHLSVAITDDKDISVDYSTTILSSLLLSSELKGYIENPAYYLQDDVKSSISLDYLMMTHGWRRYNVQEVARGNFEKPKIPFQIGQDISGKVKSPLLSRPVSDSEVMIMSKNGVFMLTSTDEYGQFIFEDFAFPDSTKFFLQASNRKGNDNVVLDVNKESFPMLVHAPQSPFMEISVTGAETNSEPKPDTFLLKAEQRSMFDEDMRVYTLEEVVISAQRNRIKKDEPRLQFWANELSDRTIRKDAFEKYWFLKITDVIKIFVGNMSRGPTSLVGSNSIEVWLDGVEYPGSMNDINLIDVESIDIFKGSSAAMISSKGANGVISITTKRWEDLPPREKSNRVVFTPLGYQKPVAFYSPKYETLEAKVLNIPDFRTTIFWKPDVVISDEGEASFEFYTSDFKTTYSAVIEGLTSDGKIIRQVEKIRVE